MAVPTGPWWCIGGWQWFLEVCVGKSCREIVFNCGCGCDLPAAGKTISVPAVTSTSIPSPRMPCFSSVLRILVCGPLGNCKDATWFEDVFRWLVVFLSLLREIWAMQLRLEQFGVDARYFWGSLQAPLKARRHSMLGEFGQWWQVLCCNMRLSSLVLDESKTGEHKSSKRQF